MFIYVSTSCLWWVEQNLLRCSKEDSSLILGKSFSWQVYGSTGEIVFITKSLVTGLDKHGPRTSDIIPAFPK